MTFFCWCENGLSWVGKTAQCDFFGWRQEKVQDQECASVDKKIRLFRVEIEKSYYVDEKIRFWVMKTRKLYAECFDERIRLFRVETGKSYVDEQIQLWVMRTRKLYAEWAIMIKWLLHLRFLFTFAKKTYHVHESGKLIQMAQHDWSAHFFDKTRTLPLTTMTGIACVERMVTQARHVHVRWRRTRPGRHQARATKRARPLTAEIGIIWMKGRENAGATYSCPLESDKTR